MAVVLSLQKVAQRLIRILLHRSVNRTVKPANVRKQLVLTVRGRHLDGRKKLRRSVVAYSNRCGFELTLSDICAGREVTPSLSSQEENSGYSL